MTDSKSKVFYSSYEEYLQTQAAEAQRTSGRTKKKFKVYQRAHKVLSKLFPTAKSVLLLGCRNDFEITTFESFGYEPIGIDLIAGEKIIVCDFAKILEHPELKNRKFDLFLSFDSVEHCFDWENLRKAILQNCTQGAYFSTHAGHKLGKWDCASHVFMDPSTPLLDIERHFPGFRVESLVYSKPHHCSEQERHQWRYDLIIKKYSAIQTK